MNNVPRPEDVVGIQILTCLRDFSLKKYFVDVSAAGRVGIIEILEHALHSGKSNLRYLGCYACLIEQLKHLLTSLTIEIQVLHFYVNIVNFIAQH